MLKALGALLLLGAALMLSGCIAELFEGFAVEGAAEGALAGAEAAGAAEAASAAAEVAAEAQASGMETVATRIARGDLAVDSGGLRTAFSDLTGNGTRRALLDVDSAGNLMRGGQVLATVEEDGTITRSSGPYGRRVLVSRIASGRIWQIDSRGALVRPVGELRGFVPGSGVSVLDKPYGETEVEILRSHSVVEILQRRGDWLEIRLLDGARGWVWSPLVAVSALLVPPGHRRDRQSDESAGLLQPEAAGQDRCVGLWTGELLRGRPTNRIAHTTEMVTPPGETVILEDTLVAHTELCRDERDLDWTAGSYTVNLTDGTILFARAYQIEGDVATLDLAPSSGRIFVSESLLAGLPVPPRAADEASGNTDTPAESPASPRLLRTLAFAPPPPRPLIALAHLSGTPFVAPAAVETQIAREAGRPEETPGLRRHPDDGGAAERSAQVQPSRAAERPNPASAWHPMPPPRPTNRSRPQNYWQSGPPRPTEPPRSARPPRSWMQPPRPAGSPPRWRPPPRSAPPPPRPAPRPSHGRPS